MKKEYSVKFEIDQTVYWVETYTLPHMLKCDLCGGSGRIINKHNDVDMQCPKCKGVGEIKSGQGSIIEKICSGVILQIDINLRKDIPTKKFYEEIHYRIRLNAEPNRVGEMCYVDEYILTDKESNITINKSIMGYTS